MTCRASIGRAYAVPKLACAAHRACRLWNTRNTSLRLRRCRSPGLLDTSVQVGLFLSCVGCHSSAEVFFLLNFFVVEGRCEVFWLQDLADLYVGFAFVGVGASLDPLDGLFERLNLPEPEAGDEFLAFGEGAVNDGAVLAGEVDAGAFGRGVKTVVAYQNSGFQELVVEFVHFGHELGIGGCAFGVFRGFDDDHKSHFVCPFGLSWSNVPVQSLLAALPICRMRRCRIDMGDDFFGGGRRMKTRSGPPLPARRRQAKTARVGHPRVSSGHPPRATYCDSIPCSST